MKNFYFLVCLFCSIGVKAQEIELKTKLALVYAEYPQMPKGILESVAFTAGRMQYIAPDFSHGCSGLPQAQGYLGLFSDGKNYFTSNLKKISKLSGISEADITSNSSKELEAYAKAWIALQPKKTGLISKHELFKQTLRQLSALPEGNLINDFANNSELYEIFKKLNDSEFAAEYNFIPFNFDLSSVFGAETFKVLASKDVRLMPQGIVGDKINVYQPSSTTTASTKSTEYGPAIWNAAPTCNYSSRAGTSISAIVIHTIQGSYSSAISWSQNCASNVSFHYVIRSSDGQVTQMVVEASKAWHVGSENPYTIGYEHEGYVAQTGWYTTSMYNSSAALTRDICGSGYGINPLRTYFGPSAVDVDVLGNCTRIKGHQHYPNQSHNDPGLNWNWPLYYRLINNTYTPTSVVTVSGTVYDSGGAAGNYSNDERSFTLIQPTGATSVTLNFTQFNLEANWDYLFIYDGASNTSNLIGTYTGTSLPGTITSTGGSLLLEFRSDCATTQAGWTANFNSNAVPPTPTDAIAPTTAIATPTPWITQDFVASYTDADNAGGAGLEKSFYQVLDYDGGDWRANGNRGYFSDNFDQAAIHPEWTSATGTWGLNSGNLRQTDQALSNTNIYAAVNHSLSNRYMYNWSGKIDGTGTPRRAGLHYFCSDPTLPNRGDSYFCFFRVDTDRSQIYEVVGDVFTLVSDVAYDFTPGQWYDFKVTYDRISGKHTVHINNQFVQTWTDATPLAGGNYISFRSANCVYEVNNLKVYRSRAASTNVTVNTGNDIRYQNPDPTTSSAKLKSVVIDQANNFSSIVSEDLNVDWTVPSMPLIVSDGLSSDISTSTSTIEISSNWSNSADINSGIANYWYAIGSSAGSVDIVPWTNNNWNTSVTHTGLSLSVGQTYYVSVRSENGAGLLSPINTSNGQQIVSPTAVPVANFVVANSHVCAGTPITIANSSTDATTYEWSFPGGTPATSTAVNPNVSYTSTGIYSFELIATGPGGTNTTIQSINVEIENPSVALFTPSSNTGVMPNPIITFNNTSTNANGYVWNFGDGGTSTDVSPWHQFTAIGIYNVELISINNTCPNDTSLAVIEIVASSASLSENALNQLNTFVSNGNLVVSGAFSNFGKGNIFLLDGSGKVVLVKEVDLTNANETISLNIQNLAQGVYYIRLINDQKVLGGKIVK